MNKIKMVGKTLRTGVRAVGVLASSASIYAVSTVSAYASSYGGGNMPWDGPLSAIQSNLSGPAATAIAGLAAAAAGVVWMKGEHGKAMHSVLGVAMGSAMLVGGAHALSWFGVSGAVL